MTTGILISGRKVKQMFDLNDRLIFALTKKLPTGWD
jgi:hypothetical protein